MSNAPSIGVAPLTLPTITQFLGTQSSLTNRPVEDTRRRVVLLRGQPSWNGPAEVTWNGGRRARVAAAPSPLAVHGLALHHLADTSLPALLVILTDREPGELDPAILARAHKQRILAVDQWDVVREQFGAEQVDPRLRDDAWAAEALLEARSGRNWPQLPGGTLSRRMALSLLGQHRLGLGRLALGRLGLDQYNPEETQAPAVRASDGLDIHTLLRWSLDSAGPQRLRDLRPAERAGLVAFLGEAEQAGVAGRALLALVLAEHGASTDAVPFGLVCAALWQHAADAADTYRARGRAERWFGTDPPATGDALDEMVTAFGRSCEEFVISLLQAGAADADSSREARRVLDPILERAGTLTFQLSAQQAAEASPVLKAGLDARFTAAGHALTAGHTPEIARAVRELEQHWQAGAPDTQVRIRRVEMAQRLTHWLAQRPATDTPNVASGVQRQIAELAWVDRALEHLASGGDEEPSLRLAYDALGTQVRSRRREIDRSFAERLAQWTTEGGAAAPMLTVEDFLSRVVAPVVHGKKGPRVLLLVLDGMSAAVATELAEQLREYWAEYDPLAGMDTSPPQRRGMAAALPTITAVSRTSLFAGRLLRGGQAEEKRAFAAHRIWGSAGAALFHKHELRSASTGDQFSPELQQALDAERTHVAVVLNTIDDRLATEQKLGNGAWHTTELGSLQSLLRAAADRGMAVLVTSDHGHVVDRHGTKVDATGPTSARHREPQASGAETAELADNEIALSGPRVVSPEPGGSIVALWDTDGHYTARQAGYHGGVSPAEVAIPVLAFLPFAAKPPTGWRELGEQSPQWWRLDSTPPGEAAEPVPAQEPRPRQRPRSRPRQRPDDTEALFDLPDTAEAAATPEQPDQPDQDPGVDLAGRLVATELFQAQVQLLARKPKLDKIERAVQVLLHEGTLPVTALAQRIGEPASRAQGFAAVLAQLLNRDGVQVLEPLPDGRTLRLYPDLLREQFELT